MLNPQLIEGRIHLDDNELKNKKDFILSARVFTTYTSSFCVLFPMLMDHIIQFFKNG